MKRINYNILFFMFTLMYVCTGCMQNEIYEEIKNDSKNINLQLSITRAVANTNGLAKAEEINVASAYVYIFNSDGALENVGQTKVINTPVLQSMNSTTDQINRLWHVKEGIKSIYVILNPQNLEKDLDTWEPVSANDIKELVTTDNRNDGIKLFNGKVEGKTKLMTGYKENLMITGNGGFGSVVIPIERRYAALELDLRKSALIGGDVTVTKVTVSNLTWQSKLFDFSPLWTGGATDENGGEIISYKDMNVTIPTNYTSVSFAKTGDIIAPERFYMSPRPVSVSGTNIPCIDILANVSGKEKTYKAYLTELTDGKCDLSKPLAIEANTIYKIQATLTPKLDDLYIDIITQPWDVVTPQDSILHPGKLGMTNCYIVNPGRSVSIPVLNVYKIWNWQFGEMLSPKKEVKAELIWEDSQGLITGVNALLESADYSYSKIQVQTATGKSGNAVVGMWIDGDPEKTYRWSWHIWVTDRTIKAVDVEGTMTMNCNLGEITSVFDVNDARIGLLYQWGRKDPFPGAKGWFMPTASTLYGKVIGIDFKKVTEVDNLINSIEKPFVFFASVTGKKDWYTLNGPQNNNLWNTTDNHKSIFDPCPEGWRVPNSRISWDKLNSTNFSVDYISYSRIYLPANLSYPMGGDYNFGGVLSAPSQNGHYWSSIIDDVNAMEFNFNAGLVGVLPAARAAGHNIRCVKE